MVELDSKIPPKADLKETVALEGLERIAGFGLDELLEFDFEGVVLAEAAVEFQAEGGGVVFEIPGSPGEEGGVMLVVEGDTGTGKDIVVKGGGGEVFPGVVVDFG